MSRHLKVLRQAGVIRQRVDGTRRLYSVRPEMLRTIADWTMDHRAFWEAGLNRLEAHLARQCLKDTLAPQDMVDAVLFLASGTSRMMTGQALVVDGGVVVTG